ncbi:MAG TPA: LPXTG cell wall anchor domain-containing protein [Acidimicrobiia bacterium]|nr:LPXTG cell wall anchor domain-containing protein [Acidimicrobiia bacterium]
MNRIRIGLVGLVVASLTGLSAGGAAAATSGRGTASSSITLLSVELGNIQKLKVLTDQGQGTLDATRLGLSGPQAFASLSAIDASGLLNLALPNPALKASAPGTSNASLAPLAVNFPGSAVSVAGTNLPIGAGLLASGTINPVKLEASQGENAVSSIVGTSVPDLSVLQGLLSIKGVNVAGLSTSATASASKGDTGIVSIDSVDVLSLSGLLGGLGLDLGDLSLDSLTGLLDSLGLNVAGGTLGSLTGGQINGLLDNVLGLLNVRNGLTSGLAGITDCSALTSLVNNNLGVLPDLAGLLGSGGPLGGLLGGLGLTSTGGLTSLLGTCSTVGALATPILDIVGPALDGLLPTATSALDGLLDTLAGAPLIQLSGVSLSAVANAADTLANSSATTTANFGTLKVGGQSLGVLDLNATVDQVNALKNTVLGTLNTVTSTLGLGNLIDIGILERTASTKVEGAYNVASAGLDLLRVSINPPANLGGLLSSVTANPLSGVLGGLNLTSLLPANIGLADNVLAQAFGLTSLLTQPTTIKVGSLGADADFTSVAGETLTQTPADGALGGGGTLPRTGGTNGAWFAALAAISLAGAAGITRSLRKAPAHQGEEH